MCRCEQRIESSFPRRSVRRILLFSFIFSFSSVRDVSYVDGTIGFVLSILLDDLFYPIVTHVEKPSGILNYRVCLSFSHQPSAVRIFLAAGSGKRFVLARRVNANIIIMRLVQEAGRVSLNQHTARQHAVRSTVYYSLKLFQLVLHTGLALQQIPLRGHCSPRESHLSLNCLLVRGT